MALRTIAVVALMAGALTMTGCVDGAQGPVTQEPITVPESLKPTNTPEPIQKLDAACASSWVKFERLLVQFDADSAQAAHEAQVESNPDDPYNIAPDAPGADEYYAALSDVTIAFGSDIVDMAAGIGNPRVQEALAGIGDGHIEAGQFLAIYTDASESAITEFQDDYFETMLLMSDYASLCDETLRGGTSNS